MRRALIRSLLLLLVLTASCASDPEAAKQAYLKSANRYFEHGKYQEAIVQYRNALQRDPRFGEARYRLVEAYEKVGDLRGAYSEAVRAGDLLPDRVDAQVKAATYLLAARQFEDAKARAEKALSLDPHNAAAHVIRGNALAGLSDFDAAIEQLIEAITIEPSLSAYLSLGVVHSTKGAQPEAEQAFRRAVEVAPKNAVSHLALANYLWTSGRTSEAEAALKTALALEPDNVTSNSALATFYIVSNRRAEAAPLMVKLAALDKSPEARAKLALADFYVANGEHHKAVPILQRVAATKEGFAPARSRLAVLQWTSKQTGEAHRTVDEVLAKHPRFARALVVKAWFLGEERKFDEALARAKAATEAEPDSAQAHYVVGLVQMARRSYPEAITAFNDVLRVNPRAGAAQLQLSRLYLATGDRDTALQMARSVAKELPEDPAAQLMLGRTLLAKNDLVHAGGVIDQLVDRNPTLAVAHALAGNLAGARRDKAAARRSYERALELDPANLEALTGITALDLEAHKVSEATNRLDVQLARAPRNAGLLLLAGRLHASTGAYDQAEQVLRSAILADPASLQAYGLLGTLYIRENKIADARKTFEAMTATDLKSVPAHTMVALLYEAERNTSEARRRYEQILQIDPNAAVAANNLAWIYSEQGGNLDVALQLAQTAKRRLPNSPEVNDTLGWIYYRKNLAGLALPPLADAATAQPGNAQFRYHLGMAQLQAGQKATGRRTLQHALSLGPALQEATDARAALARQ